MTDRSSLMLLLANILGAAICFEFETKFVHGYHMNKVICNVAPEPKNMHTKKLT